MELNTSEQLHQTNTQHNTQKESNSQNLLSEARRKLKLQHTEATQSVVDPSGGKPPRLTGRQRAKYPKLTATYDILQNPPRHHRADTTKDVFASLTSSEQYLLQPDPPGVEPFYAQLEEVDRILAQFGLQTHSSHAQVNPQTRR